ncbi:SUMO-1 activating enzyme subunit 2 isoform 5 [Reticulomyxa filosa]|uniref:SUMO-1 activating enzyme subunit 2 isoform 5 n=1 Tax=Reticulomyxa filosa TaxID=46433 RepID=X6NA36_RETFI|nr:SUMO-1 activating enzyme subunit 2 isoform 5 [Reticulomyxa filosa]|eukprot:ETO22861.1 SUMO-1 activating enzyme subunit 2 isoform 5 [Reticulomyxa filosa]
MSTKSNLRQVFGEDNLKVIEKAKVLVVGAGGIGSELLKNLVSSGFTDIDVVRKKKGGGEGTISFFRTFPTGAIHWLPVKKKQTNKKQIDLDTIEVSNLNRQFLFRQKHVGKSKAQIAALEVSKFGEDKVSVRGRLGDIKSSDFGREYFMQYDIILNALDNISARRHVNRICVAQNKVFVESGTQGFLGQVIPIIPDLSNCWECNPKDSQTKSYPVCTIRSTPDKPVHCIVWAKELFHLLFEPADESSILKDLKVLQDTY